MNPFSNLKQKRSGFIAMANRLLIICSKRIGAVKKLVFGWVRILFIIPNLKITTDIIRFSVKMDPSYMLETVISLSTESTGSGGMITSVQQLEALFKLDFDSCNLSFVPAAKPQKPTVKAQCELLTNNFS